MTNAQTTGRSGDVNKAKLLLVEDDPALLELLEYRFSNEGYSVRATADGDEALILAAEDTPDRAVGIRPVRRQRIRQANTPEKRITLA